MAEDKNLFEKYILPSDTDEMSSFIDQYKVNIMNHVVESIDYATKNNLSVIEVFQFKNSDFVVSILEDTYQSNIDNILTYFMNSELYEYCGKTMKLQEFLKKKNSSINEKTQKKQTTVSN